MCAESRIARENGVATGYHLSNSRCLEQDDGFHRRDENQTCITHDDWPATKETVQRLTEGWDYGYEMVHFNAPLWRMVDFIKGVHLPFIFPSSSLGAVAPAIAASGRIASSLGSPRCPNHSSLNQ